MHYTWISLLNLRPVEFRHQPGQHDLAAVHYEHRVGPVADTVEILLDQDDRYLARGSPMSRPISLIAEGRMPSVSSSSLGS